MTRSIAAFARTAVSACAALAIAVPVHAATVLTAKVVGSAATGSVTGSAAAGRASGTSTAGAGTVLTFTIDSLTSEEQIAQLKTAKDLRALLDTLASFRAGSISAKGQASVTINAAFVDPQGGYLLLSVTDPRTISGGKYSASSRSLGVSRLAPARGDGWLASTTQVVAWSGDTPVARAGGSQATALTEVTKP